MVLCKHHPCSLPLWSLCMGVNLSVCSLSVQYVILSVSGDSSQIINLALVFIPEVVPHACVG